MLDGNTKIISALSSSIKYLVVVLHCNSVTLSESIIFTVVKFTDLNHSHNVHLACAT